jgi:flagellar hook-associated protein 3 FlgL
MISATRYSAAAEINRQTGLRKEIAKIQSSISSEKRFVVGSEDPTATSRVSDIRQNQADQYVWTRNANIGAAISGAVDAKLTSVANILDRAKDLVLAGRNDTNSVDDRAATAAELRGLANDLATYSQQNDQTGRPLFPTTSPLQIPVSDDLNLPATATRDSVFTTTTAAGPQSLSDILNAAAAALEEPDPALRATAIDAGITAIDQGAAHIVIVRADQGVRAQRFDDATNRLATLDDASSEERDGLEKTDVTYAITDAQSKQLSLDAAQALFAKTSKSSLFDLLG